MDNVINEVHSLNHQRAGKKRLDEIDIIKALAIICMVASHAGAPFKNFIYLFHMAVFFIASGYFYKDSSSDSIKNVFSFIIKKLKQLWLPYFVWNMMYTVLNNLFIRINVYTDNPDLLNYVSGTYIKTHHDMSFVEMIRNIIKGVFFAGETQLGGAFWFLGVLFTVSVCYNVGDFLAKKVFHKTLVAQLVASIILLAFGYWCSLKGYTIYHMAHVASFYCLYFMGYLLSRIKDTYKNWNLKHFMPMFVLSFMVLLILNQLGGISLSRNSYGNPIFLLIASITGWCFLYSISCFITLLPVKDFFLAIGKRTLSIVIFHFLSFKLVGAIIVKVLGLPVFCIAAFPNLCGDSGVWWLAYTIVGIGVPIVLNIYYRLFVNDFLLRKGKK